jgi:hypothetical protein
MCLSCPLAFQDPPPQPPGRTDKASWYV